MGEHDLMNDELWDSLCEMFAQLDQHKSHGPELDQVIHDANSLLQWPITDPDAARLKYQVDCIQGLEKGDIEAALAIILNHAAGPDGVSIFFDSVEVAAHRHYVFDVIECPQEVIEVNADNIPPSTMHEQDETIDVLAYTANCLPTTRRTALAGEVRALAAALMSCGTFPEGDEIDLLVRTTFKDTGVAYAMEFVVVTMARGVALERFLRYLEAAANFCEANERYPQASELRLSDE